jgi:hypothetical protein
MFANRQSPLDTLKGTPGSVMMLKSPRRGLQYAGKSSGPRGAPRDMLSNSGREVKR